MHTMDGKHYAARRREREVDPEEGHHFRGIGEMPTISRMIFREKTIYRRDFIVTLDFRRVILNIETGI